MTFSSSRGFNLVEVMIAAAVLSIGLAAAVPLTLNSIHRTNEGRQKTAAASIGNQVLERLRGEARYSDGSALDCGKTTNSGCSKGKKFTLANAWEAERLPHRITDSVISAGGCNPDGKDAAVYNVGPFDVEHEGNTYQVCYRLAAIAQAEVPPNSIDVTVKVFWKSFRGTSSRYVSGVLLNGR